jgi:hypothetical protein
MSFTKAEVQKNIAELDEQVKRAAAELNFVLGQKAALEAVYKEMPDDPAPEPLQVVPSPLENNPEKLFPKE